MTVDTNVLATVLANLANRWSVIRASCMQINCTFPDCRAVFRTSEYAD